jgi:hypothetical protein
MATTLFSNSLFSGSTPWGFASITTTGSGAAGVITPGFGGSDRAFQISTSSSAGTAFGTKGFTALGAGKAITAAMKLAVSDTDATTWKHLFRAFNTANQAGVYIQEEYHSADSKQSMRIGNNTTWANGSAAQDLSAYVDILFEILLGTGTAGKLRLSVNGSVIASNLAINTLPNGNIDEILFGCTQKNMGYANYDNILVTDAMPSDWATIKTPPCVLHKEPL